MFTPYTLTASRKVSDLIILRYCRLYQTCTWVKALQVSLVPIHAIHAIHAIHHFAFTSFSDTVSHDVFDGLFTQQSVEFAQFCQAVKRLVSVVEIERAIMTFWILENRKVCKIQLFSSLARNAWKTAPNDTLRPRPQISEYFQKRRLFSPSTPPVHT